MRLPSLAIEPTIEAGNGIGASVDKDIPDEEQAAKIPKVSTGVKASEWLLQLCDDQVSSIKSVSAHEMAQIFEGQNPDSISPLTFRQSIIDLKRGAITTRVGVLTQ